MEQTQIEELVAELETRVDRLRSLYEQYFMGIEKMEPLVPKKDVERRFYAMRKEQIRNTALRFRFHMVLQKYNTYQSYWMRIMRQIEDGTYKRDVLRAKAAFGERRSTRPPPPSKRAREKEKENEHTVEVDTFEFDDTDFPADAPTRKVDVPALGKSVGLFDPFDEATTNLLTRPPAPSRVLSEEEDPTGILPLVAGDTKSKARPLADPEKMRQLAAQIKAKALDLKEPTPPPRAMVAEAPPIHLGRKPPPLPPKPGAVKPEPPKPVVPTVAAKPAPPAPKPIAKPEAPQPLPRPEAPKPAAPVAAAKPAAPVPVQKPTNPADLPDARVRQIYTQYVDTKRKQNESTAAITYEGVARSLRESTARLKEKHAGKAVDFEVTVKDGKTILRPVVK